MRHAESRQILSSTYMAPEVTTEHYGQSNTNFGTYSDWELDPHQITAIYPQTIHGTFPEPFRNQSGKFINI